MSLSSDTKRVLSSAPTIAVLTDGREASGDITDLSGSVTVLFGGRYELQSLLGAGGMGTVYRARDVELDETVALKVLRKELVGSPQIIDRFRSEVRLSRRVTHRNVARMFDIADRCRKRSAVPFTYEGGCRPAPRDRTSARRAPACGHGITTGSRTARRGGRAWAK